MTRYLIMNFHTLFWYGMAAVGLVVVGAVTYMMVVTGSSFVFDPISIFGIGAIVALLILATYIQFTDKDDKVKV